MFRNYLKIALRNILRQKGYSFINITGLSLGMACCLLMLLWVSDELSYNHFHENAETLFRVEQDQPTSQGQFHVNVTPYAMGPALVAEIPEIKNASRIDATGTLLVRYGDKSFFESGGSAVDPSFLDMFSFPLVKGDKASALKQPTSAVISEDIAAKYFGEDDPVGKTLTFNDQYAVTVTGVMKNAPLQSTFRPDILVPMELMKLAGVNTGNWGTNEIITMVELHDPNTAGTVAAKITDLTEKHRTIANPDRKNNPAYIAQFELMPLTGLRQYSRFGYGQVYGNIQTIVIFLIMAVFIILIACINYMNLATARSANRAKEVGLRKTVGAGRGNISFQFFSESLLTTMIAFVFALILTEAFLPLFNDISGKQLSAAAPFSPGFLPVLLGITILTGLLSGTYPALILSRFQPAQVLKGRTGSGGSLFRKSLVVFQFSLSIVLMIGTLVMTDQLDYMRNKQIGYDKEQLIHIVLLGDTPKSYSAFKEALLKDPRILGVSGTHQQPTQIGSNGSGAEWDGKDPNFKPLIGFAGVDYDYTETMKIELAEGRSFSRAYATDTSAAVMINEELAKMMGSASVVGKRFTWQGDATVIGVMKNFHYQQVQNNIEPLAVYLAPNLIRYAVIRLQAGQVTESLDYVKRVWEQVYPPYPFEYKFFDDDFAQMFANDDRMALLLKIAAIIAIIIACLGLFGLASFMTERRTKEIGIRKTLGATASGISLMLSKEFVKWVILANLLAWPAAYYAMSRWLENYAYRTDIGWWLFAVSGIATLVIAVVTVSYQSVKAARANPIESLRYE
jgi:predicted permease